MNMSFVICINNQGYDVSLEKGKVYQLLYDKKGQDRGFVRIIDASGEDYLYPEEYFMTIDLPKKIKEALVS